MTGIPLRESGRPGWDRWATWGVVALVLGMGLVIWEPFPPGVWHDDGVYVLLSRALANGEGLRYTGVPGAFLAPKFPPLFPLVLAPVWIVSPSFPENAAFFGAVNLLFLAVFGGLMMAYLRRRLGLSAGLAGVAVVRIRSVAQRGRRVSRPASIRPPVARRGHRETVSCGPDARRVNDREPTPTDAEANRG